MGLTGVKESYRETAQPIRSSSKLPSSLATGIVDGQSHNIYVNQVAQFTLKFSYSHDAIIGHLVKSRAYQNSILYNRFTGESGTSSYKLDCRTEIVPTSLGTCRSRA